MLSWDKEVYSWMEQAVLTALMIDVYMLKGSKWCAGLLHSVQGGI